MAYRAEEFELEGCTMGVVGFGGTGRQIARRAAAFGMTVIAVDCDPVPPSPEVPVVWGSDRLDELLRTADVITSGLPLTPHTRNLFDARAFALMKPSALFVNVTRGEIYDANALMAAINNGKLAGAGLDVAPQEPLPSDHALWKTPNVIMTPHNGGLMASVIARALSMGRGCRCQLRLLSRQARLASSMPTVLPTVPANSNPLAPTGSCPETKSKEPLLTQGT